MKLVLASATIAALSALPATVHGHGYMEIPMARNLFAWYEGKSGNPTDVAGVPLYQTTPQGMNRNTNVCGKDQDPPGIDYDNWIDTQGNLMPWISQATYDPGEVVHIKTTLTAHHSGHLTVNACPMGRASTQECFDSYPLEFVSDLYYGMPKDENYPDRGYLHGKEHDISMQFKLPDNLAGEEVLLQWVYWTANSCNSIGYDDYFSGMFGSIPESSGEPNWNSLLSVCPPEEQTPLAPLPNPALAGVIFAEVFINCAEVTVNGEVTPTAPVPPPTHYPTKAPLPTSPTPAPVYRPNSAPVAPPNTEGKCGGGSRGNGICPDPTLCCSQWGHCGTSVDHCGVVDGNPTAAPVPNPTEAPVDDNTACGSGSRGNGICSDSSLCCSQWGHCGTSVDHCGSVDRDPTAAPVTSPSLAPVISPPIHDSRMIAYLGNWHQCPSDEQIEQYTHIVIAFAVSYTWSANKNICDQTCTISTPLTCANTVRTDLIEKWQGMGKKVILSFGGAGMGGSWAGDDNDCWKYCFGREDDVVNQLTDIVSEMKLDGIDIDYEYFYEDNQNGSDFTKGEEAQTFLREVTLGLRDSLPDDSELTHAPMETDVVPGTGYYNVLKEVAHTLDFLMPQYYNGYVRSHTNFDGALAHYTVLTDDLFGGDPTKIVYGFCINDCGSFSLNGEESAEVMLWLSEVYSRNGGAFFWVANDDAGGLWSSKVNEQLAIDADQTCVDDEGFRFKNDDKKDCNWIYKIQNKGVNVCAKTSYGTKVQDACPRACKICCADDKTFRFKNQENKDCNWVKKVHQNGKKNICAKSSKGTKVQDACPEACDICT